MGSGFDPHIKLHNPLSSIPLHLLMFWVGCLKGMFQWRNILSKAPKGIKHGGKRKTLSLLFSGNSSEKFSYFVAKWLANCYGTIVSGSNPVSPAIVSSDEKSYFAWERCKQSTLFNISLTNFLKIFFKKIWKYQKSYLYLSRKWFFDILSIRYFDSSDVKSYFVWNGFTIVIETIVTVQIRHVTLTIFSIKTILKSGDENSYFDLTDNQQLM